LWVRAFGSWTSDQKRARTSLGEKEKRHVVVALIFATLHGISNIVSVVEIIDTVYSSATFSSGVSPAAESPDADALLHVDAAQFSASIESLQIPCKYPPH